MYAQTAFHWPYYSQWKAVTAAAVKQYCKAQWQWAAASTGSWGLKGSTMACLVTALPSLTLTLMKQNVCLLLQGQQPKVASVTALHKPYVHLSAEKEYAQLLIPFLIFNKIEKWHKLCAFKPKFAHTLYAYKPKYAHTLCANKHFLTTLQIYLHQIGGTFGIILFVVALLYQI